MKHSTANPSPALPFSPKGTSFGASGEGVSVQQPPADSPPDKGGPEGVSAVRLILNQRTQQPATDSVALAYDQRKRSRLKVKLTSGAEAGIFLERGEHLQGGDKLAAEDGSAVVEILAAPEQLIEAVADTPLLFARAAYHLGNRHVPVQILPTDNGGRLRFQTDHVLAEMVRGLGCTVTDTEAPFQPESGAYGGGHRHGDESPAADLHDPGHGPHRAVPKIHQFRKN